jgi:hypothetical protein
MEHEQKKEYEKPKLTKIRLDAKCAVLGFCKGPTIGPGVPGCNPGSGCPSVGS